MVRFHPGEVLYGKELQRSKQTLEFPAFFRRIPDWLLFRPEKSCFQGVGGGMMPKHAISLQNNDLSLISVLNLCPYSADDINVPFDFSCQWDIIALSGNKSEERT